jgi:AraC-like DNA-binding protein
MTQQRPPPGGTLEMRPPPADLAPFVFAFVHRDEDVSGGVVCVLPEPRASIQIQTADPYWLRARGDSSVWERTPRIALWAPRFEWAFGFAARRIRAFAIGLTPEGFQAVSRQKTPPLLNRVFDLHVFDSGLATMVAPLTDESFDAWAGRVQDPLRTFFTSAPPGRSFGHVVHILATAGGGAVAQAAREAGLSERQFRRLFADIYGVSPKRYQRALRVDRMIRQLHPAPWEKDAHEDELIPFADQPHAIREFREMTGTTPAQYALAQRTGARTLRSIAARGIAPPPHGVEGV